MPKFSGDSGIKGPLKVGTNPAYGFISAEEFARDFLLASETSRLRTFRAMYSPKLYDVLVLRNHRQIEAESEAVNTELTRLAEEYLQAGKEIKYC